MIQFSSIYETFSILPSEKQTEAFNTVLSVASDQKVEIEHLEKVSKWPTIVLIALGTIATLGALFSIFATFQILPSSINAISQLGTTGQALGYAGLGLGSIGLLLGGVKGYRDYQRNQRIHIVKEKLHSEILRACHQSFPYQELYPKEYFVSWDKEKCKTHIYCNKNGKPAKREYKGLLSFDKIFLKDSAFFGVKTPIDIDTLRDRLAPSPLLRIL